MVQDISTIFISRSNRYKFLDNRISVPDFSNNSHSDFKNNFFSKPGAGKILSVQIDICNLFNLY